jgi:multisubunit Na+/H+ antiporter MnhC subunit
MFKLLADVAMPGIMPKETPNTDPGATTAILIAVVAGVAIVSIALILLAAMHGKKQPTDAKQK